MIAVPTFADVTAERPVLERTEAEYGAIDAQLDAAQSAEQWHAALRAWDGVRRRLSTWMNLTRLRFSQDTQNEAYKSEREYADSIAPKIEALDVAMKRRFLDSPVRAALEASFGTHLFKIWESDVLTFDPRIEEDLVAESALGSEYTALLAAASLEFEGKTLNLASIGPYLQSPERLVRHAAQRTKWAYFSGQREKLDDLYSRLVTLRQTMAEKLGYKSYIELGYARMQRVDYDRNDVERYRDEVVREVVPLAQEIIKRRGQVLGLERVMFWDEGIDHPSGNPQPLGEADWLVGQLPPALGEVDARLGEFAAVLTAGGLIDYENRPAKALGGYCTSFPTVGVPYIFANFSGTEQDVTTLVHETGHAFQNWRSRAMELADQVWPTLEAAEVHSMSLEYLTHPVMDRFFGEGADRYRRKHLSDALLFLPYGVAVDHFQHLVYEHPQATAAERAGFWQEVERRYLPWRLYGDLEHPKAGRLWQQQRHIYLAPFYYIDYTLALCCALQFWSASRRNAKDALERYVALCGRGGTRSFRELVASAGLRSPFEPGSLADVAAEAGRALG